MVSLLERALRQCGWHVDDCRWRKIPASSNATYQVQHQGRHYCLRLHNAQLERDREQEFRIWQRLATIQLMPTLYRFTPSFSLSQWLPQASPAEPTPEQALTLLQQLAAQTPWACAAGCHHVDYRLLYQLDAVEVTQLILQLPDTVDWRQQVSDWLADYHGSRLSAAFVHQDLPGNILQQGGRLWLIDVEYAGLGHPYWDLAALARGYTPAQRHQLWLDYLYHIEAPTDATERRAWCACQWLVEWLIALWYQRFFPGYQQQQQALDTLRTLAF